MTSTAGAASRVDAFVAGAGFSPHRHDTYAIGVTTSGIQCFTYRGATRHSTPGHAFILHPDEMHDGHAVNDDGFYYKSINLAPADIQKALNGQPLPFIEGGVSSNTALRAAIETLLFCFEEPPEPFAFDDALLAVADALCAASGQTAIARSKNYDAAEKARQFILDNLDDAIALNDLEQATDQDRWQLSRDFRTFFGVSPYQYWVKRRLERGCDLLRTGLPIANVAAACQFSDQSHFTRQFRRTYGVTPKKWLKALTPDTPVCTNVL